MTEPATRTEKFVLELEYEVWVEGGLTRADVLDRLLEAVPGALPELRDA